jgi:hypothetical protein
MLILSSFVSCKTGEVQITHGKWKQKIMIKDNIKKKWYKEQI